MESYRIILVFFIFYLGAFHGNSQVANIDTLQTKFADSSVRLFNDFRFSLKVHIFDMEASDETQPNTVITLKYMGNYQDKILVRDSLFCMKPWIQFKDFNQDGIDDLLIFNTSSARSNWTHHLYIVDNKKKKIIHVKGFSKLLNPEIDVQSGIITSSGLYGNSITHSYYKISKNYILQKVSKDYEETIN